MHITKTTIVFFILLGVFSSRIEAVSSKTLAVKVFVDEEEPRTVAFWHETLARRVDQASVILSRYGDVHFSVTKFGTWDSDDGQIDFPLSLKEFEREVSPHPAELAVGFTSQYHLSKGRSNLGGTRGPLRKHILIREGSPQIQEIERLEILVHELAHYLGAAHSGSLDSVMRPILGDGQSRARAFQIRLDPQNAEIIRLVSSEMADYHVRSMYRLSVRTKLQLRDQYKSLARSFPADEVAKRYALLMEKSIRFSLAERARRPNTKKKPAALTPASLVPRQSLPPSASRLPR